MADIAFKKLILAHTLKDILRVDPGTRVILQAQAKRIEKEIADATPLKKTTKKPRKKK